MIYVLDAAASRQNTHLTWVEVDLDAIMHNVGVIKAHVGASVSVMAVVKANAYGHGAVPVAMAALHAGADRLAVARVAEGLALRRAGITAPILVLGYTLPDMIHEALAADLTLTLTEHTQIQVAGEAARALQRTAPVHVKVDTGMGRFGLLPEEAVGFLRAVTGEPGLLLEGLFTHFAVADAADKTYTLAQFAVFEDIVDLAVQAGIPIPLRHVANSAATLDLLALHLDAVRPGIALYGLHPSDEVQPVLPLRPALTLKSHVARVRTLPAGSSISYGRTYVTDRPLPVGVVPVGYGDGYHRLHSNRGAVLINGQRCPIVGRVCMDQFVVDLSLAGDVTAGDEVVLIGTQGDDHISAEEVARHAETINYEVTTGLTGRPPRYYYTEDAELRAQLLTLSADAHA